MSRKDMPLLSFILMEPGLLRRKLVAETAVKHGKFAGTVGSVGNMQELYDMGYRFLSLGADVVGLSGYFGGIAKSFREKFA